jgi:DNA-directed RNA polymerase specialized sigma24 family protein
MLRGDLAASDESFVLVAPKLRRQLRARAPRHWQDLIEGAVDQAIAAYCSSPDCYEPIRGDFMAWLATNSWHAMINAARPFDR